MIYELRTYRAMPGRMTDLVARFRDRTVPIWKRHGIEPVGFWRVLVGESNQDFIYLLAWESLAQREKIWTGFLDDPEWHAAVAATEANGPIVLTVSNQLLTPTDYSALD